jgi:hypothetical protein
VSRERQKARAAREAARRAEVEAAARARARKAKVQGLVPSVSLPRRRRRYGALPTRTLARLFVVWAVVQVVAWRLLSGLGARFSVAVITAACILVLVNTRRSTPR